EPTPTAIAESGRAPGTPSTRPVDVAFPSAGSVGHRESAVASSPRDAGEASPSETGETNSAVTASRGGYGGGSGAVTPGLYAAGAGYGIGSGGGGSGGGAGSAYGPPPVAPPPTGSAPPVVETKTPQNTNQQQQPQNIPDGGVPNPNSPDMAHCDRC